VGEAGVSAMGRTGKVEEDPDKKASYGCQLAPRLPEGKNYLGINSACNGAFIGLFSAHHTSFPLRSG